MQNVPECIAFRLRHHARELADVRDSLANGEACDRMAGGSRYRWEVLTNLRERGVCLDTLAFVAWFRKAAADAGVDAEEAFREFGIDLPLLAEVTAPADE